MDGGGQRATPDAGAEPAAAAGSKLCASWAAGSPMCAGDPGPRFPPGRAGLLRALGCRGGGVVSLPPTSRHSLVFVGSPNAFLSTMLFHYIMSIM